MAVDVEEAFGIRDNGIALKDADDNTVGYFTAFNGDPTGIAAPQNTWVFRQDTQTLYYKFGAANGDWRQVRAADLTFDPSGHDNFEGGDTDVNTALERFGDSTFTTLYEYEGFDDVSNDTTTSGGWITIVDETTVSKPAGTYLLIASIEQRNSDKQKRAGWRVRTTINGSTTTQIDSRDGYSTDNFYNTKSIVVPLTVSPDSTIRVRFDHGQVDDGGTVRTRRKRFALWRTS